MASPRPFLEWALLLLVCGCLVGANNVHPKLLEYFKTHDIAAKVSFFALLTEQADTTTAVQGYDFETRGHIVFGALTKVASQSQGPLLEYLRELNVKYQSFWIINAIKIEANASTMLMIAKHSSVRELEPNFEFRVPLERPEPTSVTAPAAIEWNINWVKAPQVWAKGFQGAGITVANADTGVQWNHPALIQQYRGYGGPTNVSHHYNWWDSVHTTGSSCGANSTVPCDDDGHGTHTTGTAVGDDHLSNQIGVAPRAKWIACRNMNAGVGTPAMYIECLQFFVAPTDLNGANPRPDLRPHVIGNSYACTPSEGCSAATLQAAVTNVVAAGIFMSVSAGNSGPSCHTVSEPPAIYSDVLTVAASGYQTSNIASYSSRGPVTVDGSNRPKPDITAPGSSVRSCLPTNQYASLSGTSMASPHVTGAVALLWNAKPLLLRDVNQTAYILMQTAISRSATTCVTTSLNISLPDGATRNNVYGHGELDALAATDFALQNL